MPWPLLLVQGVVEAMYLEEGELITAGADGFVKVRTYIRMDTDTLSHTRASAL